MAGMTYHWVRTAKAMKKAAAIMTCDQWADQKVRAPLGASSERLLHPPHDLFVEME